MARGEKVRSLLFEAFRIILMGLLSLILLKDFFDLIEIDIYAILNLKWRYALKIREPGIAEFLICIVSIFVLALLKKIMPLLKQIKEVKIKDYTVKLSDMEGREKGNRLVNEIYLYLQEGNDSYLSFFREELQGQPKLVVDRLLDIAGGTRDAFYFEMERMSDKEDILKERVKFSRYIPLMEGFVGYYRVNNDKYRLNVSLAILSYVYKDSTDPDDENNRENNYTNAYKYIDEAIMVRDETGEELINYELNRLILGINLSGKKYKKQVEEDYLKIRNSMNGTKILHNCKEIIAPRLKQWLIEREKQDEVL